MSREFFSCRSRDTEDRGPHSESAAAFGHEVIRGFARDPVWSMTHANAVRPDSLELRLSKPMPSENDPEQHSDRR